ncbi:hypothetical protein [Ulvibacter antarcticus]|uniref:Tellurite resistance protein TerB n=1 Tax=Ulvibacter antarcticus TaxID=442714 RepID=A0A3L9Z298_9FLAO|nr:hypothetical protein [Ulvibacter antarcticus]RMA64478.1 hypothetical protein BXY75_1354 [Ulvibacter antarcticus]
MHDFKTNWTRQELSAYLLLYCAHADFIESEKEVELIRSKVDKEHYKSIHEEFEIDNDYQSIQKIEAAIDRLGYNKEQIHDLVEEMKMLFHVDGEYDAAENALFTGLKHLLEGKE